METNNIRVYNKAKHILKYSMNYFTIGAAFTGLLLSCYIPSIPFYRKDVNGVRMDKTTIDDGNEKTITQYVDKNSMYYNDSMEQNAVYYYDNWSRVDGDYKRSVYKALLTNVDIDNIKKYALEKNYTELENVFKSFKKTDEVMEQIPEDLETGKKLVIYNMDKNDVQIVKESETSNNKETFFFSVNSMSFALFMFLDIKRVKGKINDDIEAIENQEFEERVYKLAIQRLNQKRDQ